jgi:hypothetical protein
MWDTNSTIAGGGTTMTVCAGMYATMIF